MAGRQEALARDLTRLQGQLRESPSARPVQGFLDGLIGGLILGAALALFVVRRAAVAESEPPQEVSIELKERATQLARDARAGAGALAEQAGVLTEQAHAALDRLVPSEKTTGV